MLVNDDSSHSSEFLPVPTSVSSINGGVVANELQFEPMNVNSMGESSHSVRTTHPSGEQQPHNAISRRNDVNRVPDASSYSSYVHNLPRSHNGNKSADAIANNNENEACVSSQQRKELVIHNWQASKSNLKERIEFLFNTEVLADVCFIVGEQGSNSTRRIPAHKLILSAGSAVFNAMLYGDLAAQSDEIEIPDVEPDVFMALLRFLYSDSIQIEPETVMTTLYTAKKYDVPALEARCVDFLQENLTSDNAFMLLSQARLFDEPKLAAMCLKIIDKSTSDAIAADGFCDVDLDTLCCVLSRDSLRIKETKLFHALVRWSEAECRRKGLAITPEEQRTVSLPALKLIRFPLMTVDEFAVGAAQSGLLTDKEIVSLFLYFTVNPKPAIEFSDAPRSIVCGNELTVNRFQLVNIRWGYNGTCDRIMFTVDHPIFVIGFGLYGSISHASQYQVHIEIIQAVTNKVIASNHTCFTCDGSDSVFRVLFEEPIFIESNANYIASASIKGPDSHYGTKGLRKVIVETPIGKVKFQFSYSSGLNNGSSVEDGQIPQLLFYV